MSKETAITYLSFFAAIASSYIHLARYDQVGAQNSFFFSLTIAFFILFIISLTYDLFLYARKGEPKDLWKLSWIGSYGILGFLPMYGFGFIVFFGFLGFLGLKK